MSESKPDEEMTEADLQTEMTALLEKAHRNGIEVNGAWDISVEDEPFYFGVEIAPVWKGD